MLSGNLYNMNCYQIRNEDLSLFSLVIYLPQIVFHKNFIRCIVAKVKAVDLGKALFYCHDVMGNVHTPVGL